MLDALLFLLRGTAQALGIFLNLNIPLYDDVSVRMRSIIIFLFLLPLFIRLLYKVMNTSVQNNGAKN